MQLYLNKIFFFSLPFVFSLFLNSYKQGTSNSELLIYI